ncbi:MAG: SDR family oxidoreductase [Planctomycetota bacterium]|nr:SDR family oxidoreductase [Planctomycetota bacterium]
MTERPAGEVLYRNQGRVVVVTGASGGIGNAIAIAFAKSGAQVISLDVIPTEQADSDIAFIRCDVSDPEDCKRAFQQVIESFGYVDVLVNNAAIQPTESYHPIHEVDEEVIERMTSVNLLGYLRMARLALPVMLEQKAGVIVNIASGQAHRTAREVGIYGPIKSANLMQTRQWAVEYARQGVRVVSVSPSAIDTPMVRATLAAQGGEEALANRHPLGRLGKADEVANAVLWLASQDAAFITGTDLEVDGGLGAFGAFAEPY